MPAPNPSASYSLTMRVEIPAAAGSFAKVAAAIGEAGGDLGAIDLVRVGKEHTTRDMTVAAADSHHGQRTGVAGVCRAIHAAPDKVRALTIKQNSVAVVPDGTAVLGLGDIGPRAAMPVMEGKAMLFKEFAGVDAFPICLDTKDPDEIVAIVRGLAPTFGGINLEDISAPRCFEIEDRLKAALDIPVFHDDQHGTAVVTLAALLNACTLTGREVTELRVLVTGLGAAGVAVTKILMEAGVRDIVGADSKGLVSTKRADYQDGSMNAIKRWYAEHSNPEELTGAPADALAGRDLFVGLSGARIFPAEELREDYIIPSVFNRDVSPAVAAAVAEQAKAQGTAQAAGDTIGFAAIDAERMRAGG